MADELKIIKSGVTYTLPVGWSLTDSGTHSFNNKLQDKAFSHGSDCVGDGKVSGRTITVEFDIDDSTEELHDAAVNEAYRYFAQSNYQLACGRTDRIFKVAGISKLKHKFAKGFKQRWSNVVVSLLLADPFRYATKSTTKTNIFNKAQTDTTIIINNPSSVDVPLIFTFKPLQTMADIKVMHVESGEQFVLTDALLTAPAVGVVNAETGTVRRDSNNAINAFAGLFLHALAGFNTYKVTCEAGTVDITYTARWFV